MLNLKLKTPNKKNCKQPSFYSTLTSNCQQPVMQHYKNEGEDKKQSPPKTSTTICNCKNSKCLKLYCVCFASEALCNSNCKCLNCENNAENHITVKGSKDKIKKRRSNAFGKKIIISTEDMHNDVKTVHAKGCHCKNSNCLKRYCECYRNGIQCSYLCKCTNCLNSEHDFLETLHDDDGGNPSVDNSSRGNPSGGNPSDSLSSLSFSFSQ